jgi:DNA primase
MFPIRGGDGSLLGFGARALDDSSPKYLNSPKTPIFDKGRILYGLNFAHDSIKNQGAVVVEGYMDAITAHQHGFTNVVASMGTALTMDQASTLRSIASTVALALDPDAAGQEATLRSMESAWGIFHPFQAPSLAQGSALNQRSRAPILKVVLLPDGLDPDQLIRQNSEDWVTLVDEALPLMDYLFMALSKKLDSSTPEGKSQLSQLLFPLVASTPDPFQQDHYFQRLASLVGVSTESLEASLGRPTSRLARSSAIRRQVRQREASPSAFARLERDPLEEYCLAVLLQNSELPSAGSELKVEYFQRPENREVLTCWLSGSNPDLLDEEIRPHWDRLLAIPLPPVDLHQNDAILEGSARRLEDRYLRRLKAEEELRLAEAKPEDLYHCQQEVLEVNQRMKKIFMEKVT